MLLCDAPLPATVGPTSALATNCATVQRRADASKYILIVDRDIQHSDSLCLELQAHGFEILLARQGWDALEVYRQHADAIAVVLINARLSGLDGPQTLCRLLKVNPQLRAAFMSGEVGAYLEANRRSGGPRLDWKLFRLDGLAAVLGRPSTNRSVGV